MKSSAKSLAWFTLLAISNILAPAASAADNYVLIIKQAELTTLGGLQQIHTRMLQAAKDYCPTYLQIRSHRDVATCIEGVVEDLTTKVADERLSNYVAAKNRPVPAAKLALRDAQ